MITQFARIVFVSLSFAGVLCADDYLTEFNALKKAGDETALQAFLTKAEKTEKENPDYYATACNYWWNLSQSPCLSTKPSEEGDLSIRDLKTGKEVGSLSSLGNGDKELAKKALGIVTEGYRRFPKRADLALGLAALQNKMNLDDACVKTMINLLGTAQKNPGKLTWLKNGKLPTPANILIPETAQNYASALYRNDTPKSDELCDQLTLATIRAFPNHPFAYNMQAALASTQKDTPKTLKYLELAHSKAPDDPIVLLNLGDIYLKSGKKEKARESYTKVTELKETEESYKNQAAKALKTLAQ